MWSHPQVVELGFPEFVQGRPGGPLFLTPAPNGHVLGPLQALKNRLAEFARSIVPDREVKPNHGWRHRFKTLGMQAGIDSRILNAIPGARRALCCRQLWRRHRCRHGRSDCQIATCGAQKLRLVARNRWRQSPAMNSALGPDFADDHREATPPLRTRPRQRVSNLSLRRALRFNRRRFPSHARRAGSAHR